MEVKRVDQNIQVGRKAYVAPAVKNRPSFTGNIPTGKPAKAIEDYLVQGKLIKFLKKLKWFDGEEGRILITAIGTGVVAPLFIAWNPYVKPKKGATQEEKDNLKRTQKYTAMRQPISAALAIPIQLSLVKPFYRFIDSLFNNPEISNKWMPIYLDKSALQDDCYIKLLENKKLKGQKLTKAEKKALLAENVEKVKKGQIEKAAEGLLENGQIRIKAGENGCVDNKSVIEALQNSIKEYAIDANNLRHNPYNEEDLLKLFEDSTHQLKTPKKDGIEFYLKRAKTITDNESTLQQVLETNLPKDESNLREYFKNLYNNTTETDPLRDIYKEMIDLSENKAISSRCSRTLERIETLKKICGGKYNEAKYKQYMQSIDDELFQRIQKFVDISKGLKEEPESIKAAINQVAENCMFNSKKPKLNKIFHDLKTFGQDKTSLEKKISQDVVKAYKSMMSGRYRLIKEFFGISLGLFVTVPITCHALNWVYPRFMDIFFPNLARSKKASSEGGKK